MTDELPAGHRARRPTVEDAAAIYRVIADHNTPLVGFADITLDDVADELEEPGFDPTTDAWVVEGADHDLVAYGWASGKSDSDEVDIDLYARDDAVAEWLWARVLERADELATAAGHRAATVDIGLYRTDERQRERARQRGFVAGTTFHRMRIDHDAVPPEPAVPDGIEVRTGPGDDAFRRDAHRVVTEANIGQFGIVARPFDEWHDRIESSSSHDWTQLRVAYQDGAAVGMLLGNDQFVPDERCGYVQNVAVLEPARGRGIARLLLRQAFAADARRGRVGTLLHVDTNNPTPALGLYERVGMRAVLVIDIWRRPG